MLEFAEYYWISHHACSSDRQKSFLEHVCISFGLAFHLVKKDINLCLAWIHRVSKLYDEFFGLLNLPFYLVALNSVFQEVCGCPDKDMTTVLFRFTLAFDALSYNYRIPRACLILLCSSERPVYRRRSSTFLSLSVPSLLVGKSKANFFYVVVLWVGECQVKLLMTICVVTKVRKPGWKTDVRMGHPVVIHGAVEMTELTIHWSKWRL